MNTIVSEIYSGASASISLSVLPKGAYKYMRAVDDSGKVLCDVPFELMLIKHWARSKTTCEVVSLTPNPQYGYSGVFTRVQQFILRKSDNHDEKETHYTMEVCSYV